MLTFKTLLSEQDVSANFVADAGDGGSFEARYVRRRPEYFVSYLSSHSGCDKACRFCHLTQTGQTTMRPALLSDYVEQAAVAMKHYRERGFTPAEWVNFNFMARGEPFLNPVVLANWEELRSRLRGIAADEDLRAQLNLSTIMPNEIEHVPFAEVLGDDIGGVSIYYSLYSMDDRFRRRWLPKAMDPHAALDKLAAWRAQTGGEVVLHWSFIEGENDSVTDVEAIITAVRAAGLSKVRFNLVRYNPYSPAQGKEPEEPILERNFRMLADAFGNPYSKIVSRVGLDVKASCGMFVNSSEMA